MVPVILTGDDRAESVIDTMRAGAFDYLTKPVSGDVLKPAIVRALAHHEAIRERAVLTKLLYEEREQLKAKIEAATVDLRQYAATCETSNARLEALLRMSQMTSGLYTDKSPLRRAFEEMSAHVPLQCIALCSAHDREFLAVCRDEGGEVREVFSAGEGPEAGLPTLLALADPKVMVRSFVERYTGLDFSDLQLFIYPQVFFNRPVCTIGMCLSGQTTGSGQDEEFLEMCAYCAASEWQQARLLQHAAQQASLGNIALELSKNLLQRLTAIRTSADLIRETVASEEASAGLDIIAENVDLLRRQTQDFRKLSLQHNDSIETVRLGQYVDQALSMLSEAIQNRGVRIESDFEVNGECVLLNGTALARTFLDVISSAVRAVEPGGQILLRLREAGGDHVLFEIVLGAMSSEVLRATNPADGQSVLELVEGHPSFLLAQRTVQSCGGQLAVFRDDVAGSTFRIMLPRNASQSGPLPEVRA